MHAPVTRPARLAWLFDVDGTLLTTQGAAVEAFSCAVRDCLGVDDGLDSVAFAGRTEPLILRDILLKHERTFTLEDEARFWNSVFSHARRLVVAPRGVLMPGVPALLDAVNAESAWVVGLLTGNMTQMAAIKLRRFGLEERFAFGGFGEMADDRNALAKQTVAFVKRTYGVPADRCIVVGDTENDVACARAAGAPVAAVATGSRSRAQLESHEPDLLLDDLSEPLPLLEWAKGIEARAAEV